MEKKINAIITGSTGMVGKGVLLTCLENAHVESVLVINRKPVGITHPKLKEIIHDNFYDLSSISDQLSGYNACYFCLGVSAFRMPEEKYRRITYDITLHFAQTIISLNPDVVFCYVSGQGTDSSESSSMMWARVKGATENALHAMPFSAAYMFRPGYIHPMKGVKSSTPFYNVMYAIMKPLYPVFKSVMPGSITSNQQMGLAMINCVVYGYEKQHLENKDINTLAERK